MELNTNIRWKVPDNNLCQSNDMKCKFFDISDYRNEYCHLFNESINSNKSCKQCLLIRERINIYNSKE